MTDGPRNASPASLRAKAAALAAAFAARQAETARAALDRGEAALAAGDGAAALRWLERAARIAPRDETARLALTLARLGQGEPGQAKPLAEIAARFDLRVAWIGLASARLQDGEVAGAAQALAAAFSGHAGPIDAHLAQGADRIAAAVGAPGWCAMLSGGTLMVASHLAPAGLRVACDGVACALRWRQGRARLGAALLGGRELAVTLADGTALLGSPIRLAALRRIEGVVREDDGNLTGWAWHPADPDAMPWLFLHDRNGRLIARLAATDTTIAVSGATPLARPRGFFVPAARFAHAAVPLSLRDGDGRDLLGSPLDPGAERASAMAEARAVARATGGMAGKDGRRAGRSAFAARAAIHADLRGEPAERRRARPRRVSIVVPVYRGVAETLACLASLFAARREATRIIVVEDASPEPELVLALARLARARRITLVRLARNRGFPGAANAGIRAAGRDDVVLLNSDTLVAGNWLGGLRDAAYAEPAIATATPFSNDATLLSYPRRERGNPMPDLAETGRLAALAARAGRGKVVEIPVGVGFCLYLRRAALDQVGLLREDVFAQGYGEENDFCLRARALGWRHVAATGVFVAHRGGVSFGAGQAALRARNAATLARLHPGYDALIADYVAADPLAPARRRFDRARFIATRGRAMRAALLITHDRGGGVETRVMARAQALAAAGWRVVLLRGSPRAEAGVNRSYLTRAEAADDYPDLGFDLPRETSDLLALLRAETVRAIEIHHLLGHDHDAVLALCRALGRPHEVHVHDYAWLCPRIKLLGAEGRYCGEPPVAACAACVAEAGREIEEEIDAPALRLRSARMLAAATRVVVPAADVAARLTRHFPALRPEVHPWEETFVAATPAAIAPTAGVLRVVLAGAIGVEKGYRRLLACALDARARDLPLAFTVVGVTTGDEALLATGKVFITGDYQPAEAVALIARQGGALGFLPSVVPETWCYTLSELWRAGLFVVAFDLGAQAERIRASGRGLLLGLDLPAPAVNNALLHAAEVAARSTRFTDPLDTAREIHRPSSKSLPL